MRPPLPPFNPRGHEGNVIFLVLIAICLFAALSYATTQSLRGSGSIERETAELDAAKAEQCVAGVDYAVNKLKVINRCAESDISYELPDGTNEDPDNPSNTSCFVFHQDGGGATACGAWLSALCSPTAMLALAIGEKCDGADIVYIGMSGGNRLYTTLTDSGTLSWNNGTGAWATTGASSSADGLANTDIIVAFSGGGTPNAAATACRALGPEWYLPSEGEGEVLFDARNSGVLTGTFVSGSGPQQSYWSSTEGSDAYAINFLMNNGYFFSIGGTKNATAGVRCIRRD